MLTIPRLHQAVRRLAVAAAEAVLDRLYVGVRFSADRSAAAEWWRQLAATAELAAQRHDARGGAR